MGLNIYPKKYDQLYCSITMNMDLFQGVGGGDFYNWHLSASWEMPRKSPKIEEPPFKSIEEPPFKSIEGPPRNPPKHHDTEGFKGSARAGCYTKKLLPKYETCITVGFKHLILHKYYQIAHNVSINPLSIITVSDIQVLFYITFHIHNILWIQTGNNYICCPRGWRLSA